MSEFRFPCSYTRLKDVEGEFPCGRRATRREQGAPKCLGHWLVTHAIEACGGDEHARKTWAFATWLLTVHAAVNAIYLRSASSILWILFFGALLLIFLCEVPLGAILWLIAAPILTIILARAGGPVLKYYFVLHREAPANVDKWEEVLQAMTVSAASIAIGMAFASFVLLHVDVDAEWMRITKWFAKAGAVLLVLFEAALLIVSAGSRIVFLPWIIVMLLAILVARGQEPLKRLSTILRV